jgi:hypothetical protein
LNISGPPSRPACVKTSPPPPIPSFLSPICANVIVNYYIVTVTLAYNVFFQLSQERNLGELKRSMFRELMCDLIRDGYNLALLHDVSDELNKRQQVWKGLALGNAEVLAA